MSRPSTLFAECLLLACLAHCSAAPDPKAQANLLLIGADIDKACVAAALTAEECSMAEAALVELGVSLQQIDRARVLASLWDRAAPVVDRLIALGLDWLLTSKGAA